MVEAKKAETEEKPPRGATTQRFNLFLTPGQIEWLKRDRQGASAAVRALITEAMAMDQLRASVKAMSSSKKKPVHGTVKSAPAKSVSSNKKR